MMRHKKLGYQDVKSVVVERIKSKQWPAGTILPGEIEFARELGVARATVNRAMRELAEAGLVERKRKAGTRVASSAERTAKFNFPIIRTEIEASGAAYRYRMIETKTVRAPDWLRAEMTLPQTCKIVYVRALHYADKKPFQVEDRWINADTIPSAVSTDFAATPPGEWLVREVPFSDATLSFFACSGEPWLADLLKQGADDPVFASERMTWLQDNPVTFARLYFGRGYRMTTTL